MTAHVLTRMARGEKGLVYVPPKRKSPKRPALFTDLGDMMRQLRLERGVKQSMLSAQSGVLQSVISKIEHGHVRPGKHVVLALARGLGLHRDATVALLDAAGYPDADDRRSA